MRSIALGLGLAVLFVCSAPLTAQNLEQRLEDMRRRGVVPGRKVAAAPTTERRPDTRVLLRRKLSEAPEDTASVRQAIEWIGDSIGVKIIVNWRQLEEEGIDPEQPVTLLGNIPAGKSLDLVLQQMGPDVQMMREVTPWYVRVLTKEQANRRTTIRIYPIRDLLHVIPDYRDEPELDLDAITEQSQSGQGGGGGSGSSIFEDADDDEDDEGLTAAERAENIADLIRSMIEPDIWEANGGVAGSIRYISGNLVIRAPMYVHRQIGVTSLPVGFNPRSAVVSSGTSLGVSGVVTGDPRYVRLNFDPAAHSSLQAIRRFPVQVQRFTPRRVSPRSGRISGIAPFE